MIVSLALLLLADSTSVALRRDAPLVKQAQASAMAPAALGDALLAPGHPPIVERELPDVVAPPPPSYVAPLDVRLFAPAGLDPTSGFCVKRSWRITGTPAGTASGLSPAPTRYRLPPARSGCEGARLLFFAVAADDRPRAFTIVRLLADAVDHPSHVAGKAILQGAHVPMPKLPLDRIFVVRRDITVPQLSPAELIGSDGRPRENWELYLSERDGGKIWMIHLALDADRIAVVRLDHQYPAPF